jgi:hypothetical protein
MPRDGAEHIAEWVKLTGEKVAQVAPPGGRQPKNQGINAVRDLGIDERDAALGPLSEEWRALLDQIEQMEGPTTMAGARAMARAALATTPLDCDGDLKIVCDPEDWFNVCIARFLVGESAA